MTAPPGNAPGPAPAADAGAPAQVHAPSRVDTLVVGQDGSSLSGTALAGLAPLAERLGATLHVLSTVPRALDVDGRHAEVVAAADRWCRGLDVRHTVVAAPDPVAALHEMADRAGAVACIGSHGAGCSACAVGSVAGDALARARHPLVVASVLADARVGQGVVACVDGGPSSAAVVELAVAWAELLDDDATVVAVTGTAPAGHRPRRRWADSHEAEAGLDALAGPARALGHRLRTRVLPDPVGPSSALCRHLRARPARLVVVSARDRAGLPWLPLGREAAGIVRHSPSPVLVLPVLPPP